MSTRVSNRQFGEWLKDLREAQRLNQAEAARRLGWSVPRLSKIEAGKQVASLTDLMAMAELFGDEVYDPLLPKERRRRGPLAVELAERQERRIVLAEDPHQVEVDSILAAFNQEAPPALENVFYPVAKVFRTVLGAQIPGRLLPSGLAPNRRQRSEATKWLGDLTSRHEIQRAQLEPISYLPAVLVRDLKMLCRPSPDRSAPIPACLKSNVRSSWMHRKLARLVVDPTSLRVSVIEGACAVMYPLRMLVPTEPFGPDEDEGYKEERSLSLSLRAAGLLASSWAQRWMEDRGRLWFLGPDGPFRDVPIPAALLPSNSPEGGELERRVRAVWEGRGDKRWQSAIDKLIDPLMAGLNTFPRTR